MNYVYGRIRLAVKSVMKEQFKESEMNKFIGCYEPYLWLPKNANLLQPFMSSNSINTYFIGRFIDNIVISCLITHYNLIIYGRYNLNRVDINRVLEDLETMIFKDVKYLYESYPGDTEISKLYDYCNSYRRGFYYNYIRLYDEFMQHWNNGKPDEWITSRFKLGYYYKQRRERHEKEGSKRTDWSWLNNLSSMDIAKEIIRRDIHHDRKLEKAFQKRNISITAIKNEINRINDEDKNFVIDCAIDRWFNANNTETVRMYINYYYNGMMDKDLCLTVLNRLGYERAWIDHYNELHLTSSIKEAIASDYE
jgi:hypothetical protein